MSQRYGAPMAQVYVDAYVRRWPRTSVAISLRSSRERLFDVDRDDAAELARRVAEWAAENLMVPALRARYRLGSDRGREPDRRAGRHAAPAGFRRRRVAGGGTDAGLQLHGRIRTQVSEITKRLWGDLPAEDLATPGRVLSTVLARANAELARGPLASALKGPDDDA